MASKTNKLVQESWVKVEALGVETVGILLFKRIFEIAPGALQMFSFRDEPNVYESAALKKHAVGVVSTVGTAVGGLDDLPALIPVLKNLGTKHVGYGVEPAHYDVVGQALLDTLALGLGPAFTPELKAAWQEIYGVVATTMKGDNYERDKTPMYSSPDDWYMAKDPRMRCTPPSGVQRLELEAKSIAAAEDWYMGNASK